MGAPSSATRPKLFAILAALVFIAAAASQPWAIEAQRVVLPNGLVLIVAQKAELPIVVAQLLIKAGSVYDGDGKGGLASFVAEMLKRGTTNRTGAAIAEEIEFVGGSLSASSGATSTLLSVSTLAKDMELGVELLSELAISPSFMSEEVEKQRNLVLSEIIRKKEDPEAVAGELFIGKLYQGHPFAIPKIGDEESIKKISRDDLLAFHRKFYIPNNSILVLAGQPEKRELIALAEKYFGRWQPQDFIRQALPPLKPLASRKIFVVDRDVSQSYIELGHFGLKRTDPDFNAVRVMNYILGGGGFTSRLLKKIRSEQGLAYSIYSSFAPGVLFKGYFSVALQTKVESSSEALNSLIDIIEATRNDSITEAELADAKSFFEGSLARKMETYGQVASLLMDQEYYGLPEFFWLKDVEEVKRLDLASLRVAAKKYLAPEQFVIAIVSKKDKLELRVKGLDKNDIEVIPR